jgi:hypothetical protein
MFTCRECEHEVNQATEICPRCGADLTLPVGPDERYKKRTSTARILLIWCSLAIVLVGSIWGFLWYVASPRTGQLEMQAETQAVQSLDEVRALLSSYADAQSGAYPKDLEPLGPQARLSAQMAQAQGYSLEYTPGAADANATIHSYSLEARPGNYGYKSFYTDPSGLVRVTNESRAATVSDPPIR